MKAVVAVVLPGTLALAVTVEILTWETIVVPVALEAAVALAVAQTLKPYMQPEAAVSGSTAKAQTALAVLAPTPMNLRVLAVAVALAVLMVATDARMIVPQTVAKVVCTAAVAGAVAATVVPPLGQALAVTALCESFGVRSTGQIAPSPRPTW